MIYRFQSEERYRHVSNLELIADRMDEVTGKKIRDAVAYIDWLFELVKENVEFCSVCCQKPATKLCDAPNPFPILGHPSSETCDAPMCDECAIEYGNGHICPKCVQRIKKLSENDDLED